MKRIMSVLLLTFAVGAAASAQETTGGKQMAISVTSPAFTQGAVIPTKYTCDGEDVSPPLAWSGVPESAKSIAVIMDDPDAPRGTWTHWVLWNLPAETRELPEHLSTEKELKTGARQGTNDFKRPGYSGPCPPPGTHRYLAKVYALDRRLDLAPGATKAELVKAMEGHVLATGELMGRYSRK